MTRHILKPLDPKTVHHVVAGWDNPTKTYYAQVIPVGPHGEDEHPTVWLGMTERISDVGILIDGIAPYAVLPAGFPDAIYMDAATADFVTMEERNAVTEW